MALGGLNIPDPLEQMRLRLGKVQNTGGGVPGTAPLAQRPVAAPAVNSGTVGAPSSIVKMPETSGGLPAPAPAPGGVIKVGSAANPPAPAAPAAPAPALDKGQGGLEDQIRGILSGFASGSTSQGYIDRAKSALGSAVEAKRAATVRASDADAIRRGLFQSGIPAEAASAAGTAAQGSFAAGLADILNNAEQQNNQGRQFAASTGLNLLDANRNFDINQRDYAAAHAGGGGGGGDQTITIIDPDTGQAYELPASTFNMFG